MRAAVVGTGWGRVHIAALQEIGVDVVALCGKNLEHTRAVASEHDIPEALVETGQLPSLGLDLITIAAPTALHAELVAGLGPTPLLCEKPAVGVEVPVAQLSPPVGPVWVNYAFPFLKAARQADAALAGDALLDGRNSGVGGSSLIGAVVAVEVHSDYDLGALVREDRSTWQWLSDVASHPWSWAVARFGPPVSDVRPVAAVGAALSYTSELGVPVSVSARHAPGLAGLRHSVTVRGSHGDLAFDGQFRLGHQWVFNPPMLRSNAADERMLASDGSLTAPAFDPGADADAGHGDGVPDPDPGPGDAWHRANVSAIAAVVRALTSSHSSAVTASSSADAAAPDDPSTPRTPEPQPFTWSQAVAMDRCVQQAAYLAG